MWPTFTSDNLKKDNLNKVTVDGFLWFFSFLKAHFKNPSYIIKFYKTLLNTKDTHTH